MLSSSPSSSIASMHPADVVVGVLREPGVHLHLPRVVRLEPLRHVVPRRERLVPRRQLRISRHHAELLLPGEHLLTHAIPALVEPTLVLLGPAVRDVVRRVAAPGREVDEERLGRVLRPYPVQPLDRLVGHRVGQVVRVVVVVEARRGPDDLLVLGQARVPLAGATAQEPVEVVEAPAVRPPVQRPRRSLLAVRGQVPLAERGGAVAVVPQDPRQRRTVTRQDGGVAGEAVGELAHRTEPDRVTVATREQSRPGQASTGLSRGTGCTRSPPSAMRVKLGVSIGPPNVLGLPKPASSISTTRTFGAPGRRVHVVDLRPVRLHSPAVCGPPSRRTPGAGWGACCDLDHS